jgi:phosphoribosylformylglycinamidine cyclo-ligase
LKTTYLSSGVNIEAGDEAVRRIKGLVKETFSPNVVTDIGSFGGCFEFPSLQYKKPVLVSSMDGVGTKLIVARLMKHHDTVGQCLVNHCVNDILTVGAQPLFFLDYIGLGTLKPDIVVEIIQGLVTACKENRCSLIGGEMAEMPDIYRKKDYDLVGTIVGIVEREQMLPRNVQAGDVLIGLSSDGLHTNGYSLARKILLKYHRATDYISEIGGILGDILLRVHRSYLKAVKPFLEDADLHAISHITGGGIVGNAIRVIPAGLKLQIDWDAWEWPPLFNYIQRQGEVDVEEMRHVFNLGIGLILVVNSNAVQRFLTNLRASGEEPIIIGQINH